MQWVSVVHATPTACKLQLYFANDARQQSYMFVYMGIYTLHVLKL